MTAKTLILMRHAEAVDSHRNGNMARPLTTEGRRQAMNAGMLLAKNGLIPSQIIVSPAARTQETLSEMEQVWDFKPQRITDARLFQIAHGEGPYQNLSPTTLLASFSEIMGDADPETSRLMVLGHNPAIANLAHIISRRLPIQLSTNYPTATATVVSGGTGWDQLAANSCLCSKVIYNGNTVIEVKDSHPGPGEPRGPGSS